VPSATVSAGTESARPVGFATTHWSVVLAARQHRTPQSERALETLCVTYWYPLYNFMRRQGYGQYDAQDLTQSFFAFVLEGETLQNVHPLKGRFRSFLLASLKNFLANEWDKTRALKRGGRFRIVSIDDAEGEALFQREPSLDLTPDKAFEQSWAMTLFNTVLARLQEEYTAEGKQALHDALQPYLTDDKAKAPHAETARRLGMGEGAVRMAVLRLRRRFGELLRAEISHTVAKPEEIDDELRALLAAVAG
jgi:RNA polymerase sigma factor (sigma-70 family)